MRVPILIICTMMQLFSQAQVTEQEKTAAIQVIAKSIAENYVYVEKGGQIASYLLTANHKGEFKKASDWDEFDRMVTRSLKEFSDDGHLYVRKNPAIVREIRGQSAETGQKGSTADSMKDENYGIDEATVLSENIGYLKLSKIDISKKSLPRLYEAMRKLESTNALVIDLRGNGGGGSEIGSVLESYFLPAGIPLLEFRTRTGTERIDSTVTWLEEKKYDKPVFILIDNRTASAAEAFAFVMQQNKRAKIVGERSAGGAHMNEWYAVNDENYVSVSTAAPSLPGTQQSWEQVGIQPDIKSKSGDALEQALSQIGKHS